LRKRTVALFGLTNFCLKHTALLKFGIERVHKFLQLMRPACNVCLERVFCITEFLVGLNKISNVVIGTHKMRRRIATLRNRFDTDLRIKFGIVPPDMPHSKSLFDAKRERFGDKFAVAVGNKCSEITAHKLVGSVPTHRCKGIIR
jgi:hypothetical protein